MSPQLSTSNKFFTFITATLLSIGLLCSSPAALAKDKFRVAWSIYVGWMPWDYGDSSDIVKKCVLDRNPVRLVNRSIAADYIYSLYYS